MGEASQLVGRVTLLTFAYGHCQTVCPGLLASLRSQVKPGGPRLVVVSLDPWRDTCGSLKGLAEHWGQGDKDEIARKWHSFKANGNAAGAVPIATVFGLAKRFGWRKVA